MGPDEVPVGAAARPPVDCPPALCIKGLGLLMETPQRCGDAAPVSEHTLTPVTTLVSEWRRDRTNEVRRRSGK